MHADQLLFLLFSALLFIIFGTVTGTEREMLTRFAAADGHLSQPFPLVVSVSPCHRGSKSLFLQVMGQLWCVFECMLLNFGSAADKSSGVFWGGGKIRSPEVSE